MCQHWLQFYSDCPLYFALCFFKVSQLVLVVRKWILVGGYASVSLLVSVSLKTFSNFSGCNHQQRLIFLGWEIDDAGSLCFTDGNSGDRIVNTTNRHPAGFLDRHTDLTYRLTFHIGSECNMAALKDSRTYVCCFVVTVLWWMSMKVILGFNTAQPCVGGFVSGVLQSKLW